MKTSEKTDHISPAFLKAQAACEKLFADKKNPHFKSRYASLEAVTSTALAPLNSNGISVAQGCVPADDGSIAVRTRLTHESGEFMETDFVVGLAKRDAQGYMSATTYGRRGALMAILGMAVSDDDGQGASDVDPRADRSEESLKAAQDKQISEINKLFGQCGAEIHEIAATCQKFSDNRTDRPDGLMLSEAKKLLPALRKRAQKMAIVE